MGSTQRCLLTHSLPRTVLTRPLKRLLLLLNRRSLPGDCLPLATVLHKCPGIAKRAHHRFVVLCNYLSRAAGVDDVISKKSIERCAFILRHIFQEILNYCDQLWLRTALLLRSPRRQQRRQRDVRGLLRRIDRAAASKHSQNENDPAQRDRFSCNALFSAHSGSTAGRQRPP